MTHPQEPRNNRAANRNKWLSLISIMLISSLPVAAQSQEKISASSIFSNPLFDTLLFIAILLIILIAVMADVVKSVGQGMNQKSKSTGKGVGIIMLLLAIIPFSSKAGELAGPASSPSYYQGLNPSIFWFMIAVICFELIVFFVLIVIIRDLLGIEEKKAQLVSTKKGALQEPSLIERLNSSVAVEKEEEILLDHNYDGIRELDNDLPPWWKYGFYITIIWACIYLIHYHVTKTGSLQLEEYNTELKQADIALAEYRKKSISLVDETQVIQLKDETNLALGKQLFQDNCAACHGKAGQGIVGPNLTDDYWLHGGSMNDIFKTIKYGYQEKGMKSWKDDFPAIQIEAIASYIKTLRGTNPPDAKEKQGVLFTDQASIPSDSTGVKPIRADSTDEAKSKQK